MVVWIASSEVRADPAEVTGPPKLYLRSGPGTSFAPEDVLSAGDRVQVIEKAGSWIRIRTGDGRTGYINEGYLRYLEAPLAETPIAATAETPMPVPAETPALAEAPTGPPSLDVVTTPDPLRDELASLRAEVEALKLEVEEKSTPAPASPFILSDPTGDEALEDAERAEGSVRVLSVALISLGVGWVLGSVLTRRRSRNQRNRLRF